MQQRAKAEGWIGTPVKGQKWQRYPIDLYPADWQAAIYKANAAVPPAPALAPEPEPVDHIVDAPKKVEAPAPVVAHGQQTPAQPTKPATVPAALPPSAQEQIDAWVEIQRLQVGWCKAQGFDKRLDCDMAFAAAVRKGEVELPPGVAEVIRYGNRDGLSRTTLANMRSRLQRHGVQGLARGSRPSDSVIDRDPELKDYIVGTMYQHPHIGGTKLHQLLVRHFGDSRPIPHKANLQRWWNKWLMQNQAAWLLNTNPDAYRNKYMVAFGSQSQDITAPNQRWEVDSTPADVMLADGRHSIIGVVEVYSRRAMLFVSKTSKAEAIQSLLRKAMLAWGIPANLKSDNGKDYASKALANTCASLQIWQDFCPPFAPWRKPHIERFFGTFSHDDLELLPGFIGHNVEERQAIRSRQSFADHLCKKNAVVEMPLTAELFQRFCDQWLEKYHDRPHSGLGGKTPNQAWADGIAANPIRPITDQHQLDLLLAEQRQATVTKQGVKWAKTWFVAPELGAMVSEKLTICTDAQDVGAIHLFNAEGFVCTALAPERLGHSLRDVAEAAKAQQQALNKEHRKATRRLKAGAKDGSLVDALVEAEAVAVASGKIVELFPAAPAPMVVAEPQEARINRLIEAAWKAWNAGAAEALAKEEIAEIIRWTAPESHWESSLLFCAEMDKAKARQCREWLQSLVQAA